MRHEPKCGVEPLRNFLKGINSKFTHGMRLNAGNHVKVGNKLILTDVTDSWWAKGMYVVLDLAKGVAVWHSGMGLNLCVNPNSPYNDHIGIDTSYRIDFPVMKIDFFNGVIDFLDNDNYAGHLIYKALRCAFDEFHVTKSEYDYSDGHTERRWPHTRATPLLEATYFMARRLRSLNGLRTHHVIIDLPNDRVSYKDNKGNPKVLENISGLVEKWKQNRKTLREHQEFVRNLRGTS